MPPSAAGVEPGDGPDDVVLINTYGDDEPVETFLEAAARLPDVRFAVTGDLAQAPHRLRQNIPPNVTLTGWLPHEDYWRRLAGARCLVVLTDREQTLQQGGWEATTLGQPLVTSDWPALREHYPQGAVHVDITPQGIAIGIEWVLASEERLREEMQALRAERLAEWEAQSTPLIEAIEGAVKGNPP